MLCCGYTLTDFLISIRLTSLALWQSNDCLSASKATLMNMDKYFMWIHYERLHNHNKAKHNKTMCIFLGVYCTFWGTSMYSRKVQELVWCRQAKSHCLNPCWPRPMSHRGVTGLFQNLSHRRILVVSGVNVFGMSLNILCCETCFQKIYT